MNLEIREASKTIEEKVKDEEETKLLMAMPRLSFYSALLIASEVGEISKFEDSSSLVAYTGLAP